MRFLLLLITLVIVIFFLVRACSNEKRRDSYMESVKTEKTIQTSEVTVKPTNEAEESGELNTEVALFEKIQAKYKAKGFESFCVLKADVDSIFLISDYMANVIYGRDNFSAAKTSLAEWIEKDKLDAYYRKYHLNSEEVTKDLVEFTVSKNTFCNDYLERRRQLDQDEINNVIHLQLEKEAHKRYTP